MDWTRAVVVSLREPQRLLKAEGDGGFTFQAAFGEPVLHRPREAYLLAGNAGDHDDLVLEEFRKPLHQQQKIVEWFSPLNR